MHVTFHLAPKSKSILLITLQITAILGGILATILDNALMFGIVTFLFASSCALLFIKGKRAATHNESTVTENTRENTEHSSGENTPSFDELKRYLDNSVRKKIQIIPVLTEQLQSVINQTDDAAGGLIQAFMGISKQAKKQLLAVQELFGNLSEQTTSDNILSQTQDSLKEIQENFSTMTSFFDKSITMITDVVSQLTKIDSVALKIKQIQKMTNILAINASIQAAHSGETGSGFKVIALEINDLSKNSNNSIKEIVEITESLTSKVTAIKQELESVYQESKNIGQRTDELFNQTTEKIGSKLEDTAGKIKGIASDAESLSKEISKVVVSIQFQDITRQQIEHVISPLATINTAFNESMEKLKKEGIDIKDIKNDSITDELMGQYTMESEREILKKIKNSGA